MAIKYNDNTIQNITYNGTYVTKVIYNNNVIYESGSSSIEYRVAYVEDVSVSGSPTSLPKYSYISQVDINLHSNGIFVNGDYANTAGIMFTVQVNGITVGTIFGTVQELANSGLHFNETFEPILITEDVTEVICYFDYQP